MGRPQPADPPHVRAPEHHLRRHPGAGGRGHGRQLRARPGLHEVLPGDDGEAASRPRRPTRRPRRRPEEPGGRREDQGGEGIAQGPARRHAGDAPAGHPEFHRPQRHEHHRRPPAGGLLFFGDRGGDPAQHPHDHRGGGPDGHGRLGPSVVALGRLVEDPAVGRHDRPDVRPRPADHDGAHGQGIRSDARADQQGRREGRSAQGVGPRPDLGDLERDLRGAGRDRWLDLSGALALVPDAPSRRAACVPASTRPETSGEPMQWS